MPYPNRAIYFSSNILNLHSLPNFLKNIPSVILSRSAICERCQMPVIRICRPYIHRMLCVSDCPNNLCCWSSHFVHTLAMLDVTYFCIRCPGLVPDQPSKKHPASLMFDVKLRPRLFPHKTTFLCRIRNCAILSWVLEILHRQPELNEFRKDAILSRELKTCIIIVRFFFLNRLFCDEISVGKKYFHTVFICRCFLVLFSTI